MLIEVERRKCTDKRIHLCISARCLRIGIYFIDSGHVAVTAAKAAGSGSPNCLLIGIRLVDSCSMADNLNPTTAGSGCLSGRQGVHNGDAVHSGRSSRHTCVPAAIGGAASATAITANDPCCTAALGAASLATGTGCQPSD